ncbi:hypothetical protein JCM10003_3896 [Bacteroides pyogenes JCM 10003]|nr:hypothetical protein JCM10003_3896 [Bacteroides pyogenes JCM 10003]
MKKIPEQKPSQKKQRRTGKLTVQYYCTTCIVYQYVKELGSTFFSKAGAKVNGLFQTAKF